MSLPLGLRVIGLLVVGYLFIGSLLAMGPIGWAIIVPLLGIGAVQVYRNRTQDSDDGTPDYCPSCGSAIEFEALEADVIDDDRRGMVRYCPDCGARVRPRRDADRSGESSDADRSGESRNCPDCGAPNAPDRTTCEYCDASL